MSGACLTAFTVPGEPVAKPRMTRRDRWKQRPVVLHYRAWCDVARRIAGARAPGVVTQVKAIAYFGLPASWSQRRRVQAAGQLHQVKPDIDNVAKAILDALVERDQTVATLLVEKRWDDGRGARVEIMLV